MKKIIFFLGLSILSIMPLRIFAQVGGVGFGKRNVELLNVVPGKTVTGTIIVRNTSNKPKSAIFSTGDFTFAPQFDGRKKPLPPGSTTRSCAEWIKLDAEKLELSPREEREITYRVEVPDTAQGGYYGMLFVQDAPTVVSGTGVAVRVRNGCAFFVETSDTRKTAQVENITITGDNLQGEILNTGNAVLIIQASFYVMDTKGKVLDKGEMKKIYLPWEEKTTFSIGLSKTISQGQYTLFMTFDLKDGASLMREVDFTKGKSGDIKIVQIKE